MRFAWREKVGLPECPYMVRWVADFGLFSIRLHHWLASDDQRYPHDHPWNFIVWVIRGSYIDITPTASSWDGFEGMSTGTIRYRKAEHQHKVYLERPTWTLLLTGPKRRRSGFWINGKLKKVNKYFFENGHHPCDDGEPPVRTPTP